MRGWAVRSSPPSGVSDADDQDHSRLEPRRTLERVTFRTTDEQLTAIESLVEADVYPNRSEVIRAGIEAVIEHHARTEVDGERD